MRPAAVPGVASMVLGLRGRERAPGSGVSGAGAGREVVSVGCEAVADDGVCWHCLYACWALQNGNTALILAAFSGRVEAMALLLDRGADLEARSTVSRSAA